MCGKSRKHSFNSEVIVDSSISRAWTSHAIFLSDRNDPLSECWYNLSNLTNQRVYQELVYRNGSFKEMITGSAAAALPSFLSFYFPRAFSTKQARLSRSLEQAIPVGPNHRSKLSIRLLSHISFAFLLFLDQACQKDFECWPGNLKFLFNAKC